jgi:hypothetical protein
MKPVNQLDLREGKGDCLRACVASIFEFPVEDMPNFWNHTQDVIEFWEMINEWTRKNLGMACFPIEVKKGHEFMLKDVICIAVDKRPGYNEEHAVVWCNKMIHDPHPVKIGIEKDPNRFILFIHLDPKHRGGMQ